MTMPTRDEILATANDCDTYLQSRAQIARCIDCHEPGAVVCENCAQLRHESLSRAQGEAVYQYRVKNSRWNEIDKVDFDETNKMLADGRLSMFETRILYTAPPAVTDEMVARGLGALVAFRGTHEGEIPIQADDVRAALEAALNAPAVTDDRPTWEETRSLMVKAWNAGWFSNADSAHLDVINIIAEFRGRK